jgi:hypothetical protein
MKKSENTRRHEWVVVIAAVSLALLGSLAVPSVGRAQAPGDVCVLKLIAEGEVLSILADVPQNFSIALALPMGKSVNVPVPCDQLSTMGLAVSNQKNTNVNFAVQVFTHEGHSICTKGPFLLPVNGATGVTFADCP